jgi:putative CocE/NonD family hydrolase
LQAEQLPGLDVTLEANVPCRMPDGVTLRADVYRPLNDGSHPVLLMSDPYDKTLAGSNFGPSHPAWYASNGYVVVVQDCRGRYRSEGMFYPFVHEADDVAATIAWARDIPGADGRVAMYGFSYAGLNQLLVAQRRPEGLAAIAPAFTAASPYAEMFYTQGAFSLAFAASWATYLALDIAGRRGDDIAVAALEDGLTRAAESFWVLPLTTFPALTNKDAPFYLDWLAHPTHDDYWRRFDVTGPIDVPTLHVGGWYDIFARGTVRSFAERAGEARTQQKLVLGPWHHMPWVPVGGATGDVGAWVIDDWHLRFYGHVLKGEETGVFEHPVTAYVMNTGWRAFDGWPPSGVRPAVWFLHSDGRAQSSHGTGTLSPDAPSDEPADVWVYEPGLPALSAGGHSCCIEALSPMGPADQSPREATKLVLVYTSEPLQRDLDLVGDVQVTLYAASSATDTDFAARFCVVDALGRSTNLVEGIVRARSRESATDPAPITPNEVYEYRIELGPVGVRVPAGNRLRVDIASSDFPQWDRNLNSGGPIGAEGPTAIRLARQVVLHNRRYPSRITLPEVL